MIELSDVHFSYPRGPFQLRIPRLTVQRGQHIALTGPSGSGKTTLLNLIAGVLVPDHGQVQIDGVTLSSLPDSARRRFRAQRIGFVFQNYELLDYLSVEQNILLALRVGGAGIDSAARTRAVDLAARVGLAGKLSRKPARLSAGERQRVAICRALVTQPALLLADEPTSSLDEQTGAAAMDFMLALAAEQQATVLVLTHDRNLLNRFDHILDMTTLTAVEQTSGVPL